MQRGQGCQQVKPLSITHAPGPEVGAIPWAVGLCGGRIHGEAPRLPSPTRPHGCNGSLVLPSHCPQPGAGSEAHYLPMPFAKRLHRCPDLCPGERFAATRAGAETQHTQPTSRRGHRLQSRCHQRHRAGSWADINQRRCCGTSSGASGMGLVRGRCRCPASLSRPSSCCLSCASGPLCAVECSENATCKVPEALLSPCQGQGRSSSCEAQMAFASGNSCHGQT